METLANRLKSIRKEKKLTLEQVAKDLNTTNVTISRYENGVREPKGDILKELALYYGVSLDYLAGLSDDRTSLSKSSQSEVRDAIEEMKHSLKTSEGLMFDGEPITEDALEDLLSALEIGLAMAKKKQDSKKMGK
ncbi:XRE family transcriptional regulator [Romboutsia weinsteinii]|uniref:XRE family transcriptional regulator n=1 Tax=Romboutsia weinsteinii TaxID=2020949 RepID=A0A371J505_9FIRM|nr:helix-turn-helix transcriptional regulator [Romboutsia weinsteinii]RDY27839.1 XRE family transcriptional regulator [Romboutsia weinsteinii]